MPHAPALPDTESRIGPFRLVRPISQGGMARVYEGRLDSLHGVSTRVAVKVIHPELAQEPGFQELFVAEARISARLEHQNLVRIQQFNQDGRRLYLVMEYIDGITFRKMISLARKHGHAYPVDVIAELGRQVCEGLHYAHMATTEEGEALHLVHRDVKPSNLMLNSHGVVKVLDFGISYAHPAHVGDVDQRGAVKGTWGYMAPEQADADLVGPAADLFGLGAVLYELAAQEPLFDERDAGEIRRLLSLDEAARRAAALGGPYGDLAGVLVRALQRDPAARFSSAASMGRALGAMVGDPLRATEGLVALHRELLRLDGVQPADRSRSVSTVSRKSPSNAKKSTQPASTAAKGVIAAGSVFALGLLGLSIVVLGYTLWRLWDTRPPEEPPVTVTPPPAVAEAPAEAAPPVPPTEPAVVAEKVEPKDVSEPTQKSEKTMKSAKKIDTPSPDVPAPAPAPAPAPTPTVSPASPSPAPAAATGTLTLGADVRSQVIVDGKFLQYTPLMKKIASGRHTVKLVADDGRSKTFSVEVPAGGAVQKVWLFDEGRWGN